MSGMLPGALTLSDAAADAVLQRIARDAVRSEERDRERIARVVWSVLVEPGDGVAGALVAALGARGALDAVWCDEGPGLDADALAVQARRAAEQALRASSALADELTEARVSAGFARWAPRMSRQGIEPVLRMAASSEARVVIPADEEWPERLADLGDHGPQLLWCLGDAELLSPRRAVALVGSRNATAYGTHVTGELAAGLAERGYCVISGAAYGIDGAAHRTALAVHGSTVAVLAGGVDRFYPAGHTELIERIAHEGAVISETPFGCPPTGWRFLARNRLIAALSDATVVVEAGRRSGSLNTAHHASTIGRPLGAVPGAVTNPESAGCHQLLRGGAQCVTGVDDVVELAGGAPSEPLRQAEELGEAETRLLSTLSPRAPRSTSALAARAGLTVLETLSVLGRLSLVGRARQLETGWVSVPASRAARRDA